MIESMNNLFKIPFILATCFFFCFSSYSQPDSEITRIRNYCDSLDQITDIQHIFKNGGGVTLDYIISDGELIKIIEHPSGYKFISARESYYFKSLEPVFVGADIELSSEDGDVLTIELHEIYLGDNRILRHLTSEQTFNADSLYEKGSDPVRTIETIKKNAILRPGTIKPEFEKGLFNAIGNYLKARTMKEGDPFIERLYSPFI
jgi:hypothetical protein